MAASDSTRAPGAIAFERAMSEMTWYIRGSQWLAAMSDEFIQGPFRLIFRGNALVLRIEGSLATPELLESIKALGELYIANLGYRLGETLRPLTEEEFGKLPPWAAQTEAMANFRPDRQSARPKQDTGQALRGARDDLISYGWPLKACYEYMQDAAYGSKEHSLPKMYKMVETMENHVGGEAKLCQKPGFRDDVTFLKKLANEQHRDERHAPSDKTPSHPPTDEERDKAYGCATRLLRKFEELCRSEGLAG